ncbi:topoisomerase C-terminal repeat-containing protein [Hymenobacter sp. GOD-10R]|uniref:topoisomerase C-terminal repeat-containing protein n=1 Tax=Hymenobacter sp. GOD-10R TaxID=3093922 RepID=UPI002D79CFEE|nr:topoisomerase C-terminal repeat-containing protein [Hymenobacter sp. GOD-10R]WRQ31968.1 topoisomerase C-terminal repeat-containing protein [Hymenobacter sp. GOD-10R]
MIEQTEPKPSAGEQQVSQTTGPAAAPKKAPLVNIDTVRDEFITNAQPVADALRKSGKEVAATQLEEAAKIIGVAVGPQPAQRVAGDSLKGDSVGNVLKNIWDVIEKDPTLKKLPEAKNLRKASDTLDGAGLLNITVRNGVIVSFVSNFAENFANAQQHAPKPEQKPAVVKESLASAARVQQMPAKSTAAPVSVAPVEQPAKVPPQTQEKAAALLSPALMEKARELHQQSVSNQVKGFTREDVPAETLAKMGVQVSDLEKSGQLQKLLSGQKTDLISSFSLRNEQGEAVPFAAKLVLKRDEVGAPSLQFDLPKHQLIIPEQILGKEITPAMRQQLVSDGVVPLADGFRDGKGQTFAAYVAIDKDMNRVVAVRREGMILPKEVLGIKLTSEQQKLLLEGQPTKVEGMTNSKNQLFDATVQIDPVKRQLNFRDVTPHVAKEIKQEAKQEAPRSRIRL